MILRPIAISGDDMPRYALTIEYHGGPFAGWQRQSAQHSVQGAIEAALDRIEAGTHLIVGAGRTDSGVHASGQVAHCDMAGDWDPFRLTEALNYHLRPEPVAVLAAAPVPDDWHARFSALERRYMFRLICRRADLTFDKGLAWRVSRPLDGDLMRAGAAKLLGRHDFTTFRSAACQADNPVRTLDALEVEDVPRSDGREFRFHVRARSFLHNQVRSMVGTLERVGLGIWTPDDVASALAAKDRAACGPVSPPDGLYLAHVGYVVDPFA